MVNNKYVPVELPKTETIFYFDEAEWNKDLTFDELKQQEIINTSYHDEINSQEKGYGPCIKNRQLNYDNCYCSSDELDRQLKIIRNIKELGETRKSNGQVDVTIALGCGGDSIEGIELSDLQFFFYTSNRNLLTNEGRWTTGGEYFAAPSMVSGYKWRTGKLRLESIESLRELLNNLGGEITVYSSERGITTFLATKNKRRENIENQIKKKIWELIDKHSNGEDIVDSYHYE